MTGTAVRSYPAPSNDAGPGLARLRSGLGLVGGLGVIGFTVLMQGNHSLAESYLYGWMFLLTLTLGCFGLSLLHHTVRGKWTLSISRLLEAGSSPAVFLTVGALYLPILLTQMPYLYEWANPEIVREDWILRFKSPFLNMSPLGFPFRFVVYFGLWSALSWGLRNSVSRQEKTGEFELERGRMTWGAVGLVAFMLSATLALTDFGMSLEPHWSSTMYGVWMIIAGAGAALALCNIVLCINANKEPYRSFVHPGLLKDLGNMQFAFTMLWGYVTVSQFLIIWNGNLPETTSYFAKRSNFVHVNEVERIAKGTANLTNMEMISNPAMHTVWWGALGLALILGRFFIPFFVLVAPRTKKTPMRLAKICGWILVMHALDVYQLVIPAFHHRNPMGPLTLNTLVDLGALAVLFFVWLAVWAWQTGRMPLAPSHDTRLQEDMLHAH